MELASTSCAPRDWRGAPRATGASGPMRSLTVTLKVGFISSENNKLLVLLEHHAIQVKQTAKSFLSKR